LSEELHRQKEKERLRKEYIEELKKRHEEEKNRLEALHLKEQAGRRDDQVEAEIKIVGDARTGTFSGTITKCAS